MSTREELLDEFIQDVEAVGIEQVAKEWPDLAITYRKAKLAVNVVCELSIEQMKANQAYQRHVNEHVLGLLECYFPWLNTEEEANGGDTVDAICDWYRQLKEEVSHEG